MHGKPLNRDCDLQKVNRNSKSQKIVFDLKEKETDGSVRKFSTAIDTMELRKRIKGSKSAIRNCIFFTKLPENIKIINENY